MRGQITLFIVVGLVLLFGVALVWLIMGTATQEVQVPYMQPTTPIERFVSECMQVVARDGLFTMGMQGGYITIPPELRVNPSAHLRPAPGSPLRTPLWHDYDRSYIPSLEVMQNQLAEYVEQQVVACLNDFTALSSLDIVSIDEPVVSVSINQRDVSVAMEYRLVSQRGNEQTARVDRFVIGFPIELYTILETGRAISEASRSSAFFESATIDLMAMVDPRVPLSGIQFTCREPVWSVYQVRRELQDILYTAIPLVRVRNTDHRPFEVDDMRVYERMHSMSFEQYEREYCTLEQGCRLPVGTPPDQFEFNRLYMNAGLSSRVADSSITAAFRYSPSFGMDMVVRPSQNGLMRASMERGNDAYLRFFCMQVYHFTYDITYPVEVAIAQQDAYGDGEDFVLRFGLPVNIRRNMPSDQRSGTLSAFDAPRSADFCDSDGPAINLYGRNYFSGQSLEGVEMSVSCIRYVCDLGTTQLDSSGVYRLQANLPSGCFGGVVTARRDGYVLDQRQHESGQQTMELHLLPLIRIPYTIVLSGRSDQIIPNPLSSHMMAYVSVSSQNIVYDDVFIYDPNQQNFLEVIAAPDTYNLSVMVYGVDDLVGGYVGTLQVDASTINKALRIHAYERVPHPRTAQEVGDFYMFLRDDTQYQQFYGAMWE